MKLLEALSFVPFILGLWIVPGVYLSCLVARRSSVNPILHHAASIVFFFVLYLIFDVLLVRVLKFEIPDVVFLVAYFSGLGALIFACSRAFLRVSLRESLFTKIYMVYFLFVVLCTAIPFRNVDTISRLSYGEAAQWNSFWARPAHDNGFQFFNGQVIAEYEHFDKYYGNARLTYQPQDREMLPGVLYSFVARVFGGVRQTFKQLYLIFNIWGIALNATIVFVMFELTAYLFPLASPYLIVLTALLTSFSMFNTYYTWFKLAGAAFFVMGLIFAMRKPSSTKMWASAGLLWGLGANMHGSAALIFPFFLAYILWLARKENSLFDLGKKFLTLVGCFSILVAPWNIIKKVLFDDNDILIREFLMDGYSLPGKYSGLKDNMVAFFKNTPLSEQFTRRICQFEYSLHKDAVMQIIQLAIDGPVDRFFILWNRKELGHPNFLFLALICAGLVSLISGVLARLRKDTVVSIDHKRQNAKNFLKYTVFSAYLFLLVPFVYVTYPADSLVTNPMSFIVIILVCGAGLVLTCRSNLVKAVFIVVWMVQVQKLYLGYRYYSQQDDRRIAYDPRFEKETCILQ